MPDWVALLLAPGALGIFFFPYLQIARGKLVPESFLDAEREEKEHWRKAAGDKDGTIAEQAAQLGEYMETTRLARNTWAALEQRARE